MHDTLVVAISQSGTTTDTNRTVDLAAVAGRAGDRDREPAPERSRRQVRRRAVHLRRSRRRDERRVDQGVLLAGGRRVPARVRARGRARRAIGDADACLSRTSGSRRCASFPTRWCELLGRRPAIARDRAAQRAARAGRGRSSGNGVNRVAALEDAHQALRALLQVDRLRRHRGQEAHRPVGRADDPRVRGRPAGLERRRRRQGARDLPRAQGGADRDRRRRRRRASSCGGRHDLGAARCIPISRSCCARWPGTSSATRPRWRSTRRPVRCARRAAASSPSARPRAAVDDPLVALAVELEPLRRAVLRRRCAPAATTAASTPAPRCVLASLLRYATGVVPLDAYQVELRQGRDAEHRHRGPHRRAHEGDRGADAARSTRSSTRRRPSRSGSRARTRRCCTCRSSRRCSPPARRATASPTARCARWSRSTPRSTRSSGWTRYASTASRGDDHPRRSTAAASRATSRRAPTPTRCCAAPSTAPRPSARSRSVRGRADGRTLMLVPEVKGNQTTGLTLLHVRFRDRLAGDGRAPGARGIPRSLPGHRRPGHGDRTGHARRRARHDRPRRPAHRAGRAPRRPLEARAAEMTAGGCREGIKDTGRGGRYASACSVRCVSHRSAPREGDCRAGARAWSRVTRSSESWMHSALLRAVRGRRPHRDRVAAPHVRPVSAGVRARRREPLRCARRSPAGTPTAAMRRTRSSTRATRTRSRRVRRRAGGAAAVRGHHRLPGAAPGRAAAGRTAGHLRLRRVGAPGRAGAIAEGADGARADTRRRRPARWPRAGRRLGAATRPTAPPEPLDAAILFARPATLVPVALEALDRGGTLADRRHPPERHPAAGLRAPPVPGARSCAASRQHPRRRRGVPRRADETRSHACGDEGRRSARDRVGNAGSGVGRARRRARRAACGPHARRHLRPAGRRRLRQGQQRRRRARRGAAPARAWRRCRRVRARDALDADDSAAALGARRSRRSTRCTAPAFAAPRRRRPRSSRARARRSHQCSRSTSLPASTARPARRAASRYDADETICVRRAEAGTAVRAGPRACRARAGRRHRDRFGARRACTCSTRADLALPRARVPAHKWSAGRAGHRRVDRHDRCAADGCARGRALRRGHGRVRVARRGCRGRACPDARSSTRALSDDRRRRARRRRGAVDAEGRRALPRASLIGPGLGRDDRDPDRRATHRRRVPGSARRRRRRAERARGRLAPLRRRHAAGLPRWSSLRTPASTHASRAQAVGADRDCERARSSPRATARDRRAQGSGNRDRGARRRGRHQPHRRARARHAPAPATC